MSKSKFADCSEIVSKGLSLSTRINSLSHEVLEISAEEETLTDFFVSLDAPQGIIFNKVNFAP